LPSRFLKATVSWEILGVGEAALDLYFQKSLKPWRCHRISVVFLDNEQRLLPGSDHPGQKHQEHPIRFGTGRSFHLSPQDDQRLSQEGVFCDQFGLTSRKVGQRSQDQSGGGWFGPVNETLMERPKTQACQPCDERENPLHSVRSPL
jgi:hypothetical protein